MKIQVTEHKSSGTLRAAHLNHTVRVFVDNDFHYGYFVQESLVFSQLSPEQRATYLADTASTFDIEPAKAQLLIDAGLTPYAKAKVA